MNKFVVPVLDSFGVGAMEDVPQVRPNDIGADTCAIFCSNVPISVCPQWKDWA